MATRNAFRFSVFVHRHLHSKVRSVIRPLEAVFVTPNLHRIHHGAKGLTGKNLGFVFTWWDRMFGTFANTRTTDRDFPLTAEPTRKKLLRMIVGL